MRGFRKPGSDRSVESPAPDEFVVGTGEIVVIATDSMVEAMNGEENFVAALIERTRKGESLGSITRVMLDDAEKRQNSTTADGIVESSFSMVAFKIPGL